MIERGNAFPLATLSARALELIQGATRKDRLKGNAMAWTTPILVEICVGLEINGYLPAEF